MYYFYRTQVSLVRSMDPSLYNSLTKRPFEDLTDVTLADEDTDPILTDNAEKAIQGSVATQVTHIPHICHKHPRRCLCKFFLPGVKFS